MWKYNTYSFEGIEITDSLITYLFRTGSMTLNSNFMKLLKRSNFEPILKYLESRYSDSDSFQETFFRIFNKIENKPRCKICGAPAKYNDRCDFLETCSKKCSYKLNKIKREKTYLEKYGCKNGTWRPESREKRKKTCLERYGVDCVLKSKKVKNKRKETCLEKYGVESILKVPEVLEKIRETNIKRHGADNPFKLQKFKEKSIQTKRKNKTFNYSKIEEQVYQWLVEEFSKENIFRQYKEKRYPWFCDFYIKPLDMFIEIQGFWTHGLHPFDSNNPEDVKIVEEWKMKSKESPLYFNHAINGWTVLDPKKRQTAKDNHLKYIEIFNTKITRDEFFELIQNKKEEN